jgi:hypothetical protein
MAMVDVTPFFWPAPMTQNNVAPNITAMGAMNASGDRVAIIVECPKAGTLDKFEFFSGTVSNTPDNGIRCSFQTIAPTTGNPDGTQDQFRDILAGLTSATWMVPGLITSDGTDTGAKRTVSRGELVGCVVDFVSFVASDTYQVATVRTNTYMQGRNYNADGSSGAYTKGTTTSMPIVALKYDDGSYAVFAPDFVLPITGFNTFTFNSGSTPDERALKFSFAGPVRVRGAWIMCDLDNDTDVVLYDSDGSTVLATATIDKDLRFGSATTICPVQFSFPSSVSLAASTNYYLSIKPGASSISAYSLQFPGTAYLAASPWGANAIMSTRTDAGAWSDETDEQLYAGLIIDGIDNGAGGGGGGGTRGYVG